MKMLTLLWLQMLSKLMWCQRQVKLKQQQAQP